MTEVPDKEDQKVDAPHAGERLSVAEFRERMVSWNRISTRTAFFIGLGLVTVSVATLPLAIWVEQRPGFAKERELVGVCVAGTALAVAMAIGWLLYRQEQRAKSLGLACPECCRPLAGGMNGSLAMAMRVCPHCHKRFLADDPTPRGVPDDGLPETGSVMLADLDLQQAAERKRFRRVFSGYLATSLVCAGLSAAAIWSSGFWSFRFVPEMAFYPTRILPVAAFVIVGGVGMVVAQRVSMRERSLKCPECGDTLWHRLTLRMTGNCTSCGHRALVDPLITQASHRETVERLLTRGEFRRRSRAIQMRAPLCCLAGGAAAFLWIGAVFWQASASGRSHLRDELDPLTAGLACFGVAIQIGVVVWTEHRLKRRLACHACDQPLSLTRLIQATGCCTNCGRQVLHTPSEASESDPDHEFASS